jgi:ATP-binding cassette subfamily C (CFTR/MRP) protein 1
MSATLGLPQLGLRATNSTALVSDDSFGPFLKLPSKETFDFTLLFEETILSIGPSALLLLLIPPRILQLWKASRKVTGSYLQTAKTVRFVHFMTSYADKVFLGSSHQFQRSPNRQCS